MNIKRILILVVLLTQSLFAKAADVESVCASYFDALKTMNLEQLSELSSPKELHHLREQLLAAYKSSKAKGITKHDEKWNVMTGGNPDILEDLNEKEFFIKYFEMVQHFMPQTAEIMKNSDFEILGFVKEDEIQHCMFRTTVKMKTVYGDPFVTSKIEVVTLEPVHDEWKIVSGHLIRDLNIQRRDRTSR